MRKVRVETPETGKQATLDTFKSETKKTNKVAEIEVLKGDITKVKCDAIVNPSNSFGFMGGGVALAIKNEGGEIIESEAMMAAPIPVGRAVYTQAGKLQCRYVIHSPTMEKPAEKTTDVKVRKAVKAALIKASKLKLGCIAFPGMGTGVGGLDIEKAAQIMFEEASRRKNMRILFVAREDSLYEAFKRHLK